MATSTTRLALRKPAGSDLVNVATDIDTNMDILDSATSFEPLASLGGTAFTGKSMLHTGQSNRPYVYDGTRWLPFQTDIIAITKTADETVNNSNTLQNDDHLFVSLSSVNVSYWVECFIRYTSTTATPDLKIAFTVPAGATFAWTPNGLAPAATADDGTIRRVLETTGNRVLGTIAATEVLALPVGVLTIGGTLGPIQFQWSQNTATAENTVVKAGSAMLLRRLTPFG